MRAAAWGAPLAAASLLLLFILVYRVNGPEWDHVTSAEIFWRWDIHQFTPAFLFKQHNEHRIAAPRLAILALGLLTKWNNPVEMIAHWALMCTTALVLFGAFRRELGASTPLSRALFLFAPIALLSLSPRSYEAFMGFGFPHYLSILFYVAALRVLVFGSGGWRALAAAIVCAALTTFSLANGLLVWPIGLALILSDLRIREERRRVVLHAAAWSSVAAITIAGYFHNYLPVGAGSSRWFVIQHPVAALGHFLALNGSVFAASVGGALTVGAVVVPLYLLVGGAVVSEWWRRRARPPYGFWLIVGVLASDAMITLNRAGFGVIQALDSRYTATIALAPIGLYWCVTARRHQWAFAPALTRAMAALMVAGYAIVSVDAWSRAPSRYSERRWVAYLMYTAPYQPDSLIARVYPVVNETRVFASELQRLHLNVFADPHISSDTLTPTAVRPPLQIDTIDGKLRTHEPIAVGASDAVEVRGYAANADNTRPARAMFITVDGTRDLPAQTGLYRPVARQATGREQTTWGGFAGSFTGSLLEPGAHTLALKVVADDGRHVYVTEPIARIVRR